MSFCSKPMVAANNAVAAPTVATTAIVVGDRMNRKFKRAIM